jgi:hypothetical protein
MRTKLVLLSIVLLAVILVGACGPTPAPTTVPAGPPALVVTGKVSQQLSLTLDDLKALGLQKISAEHPKKGMQDYEGVLLNAVLDQAGLAGDATAALFTASDGYTATVAIADIKACAQCLVAIDGNALSMVMPGMSSKAWVKDPVSIEIK